MGFLIRIGFVCCIMILGANYLFSQNFIQIPPSQADGLPISSIDIYIVNEKDNIQKYTDSAGMNKFYKAFGIRPGSNFNQFLTDAAVKRINEEPFVKQTSYEILTSDLSGSVYLKIYITNLDTEEQGKSKKLFSKNGIKHFPIIYEGPNSKFTFMLNGASGIFNETNAFFSKGPEFTQGSPIATNPAGKGNTFWGEAYLEPGIGGMFRLFQSKIYLYGAASVLFSGRNTDDIYSSKPAFYGDFERLYGGLFFARLGKKKDINIDISCGRNFFQLNDAFLISRISGSANAGPRASLYLSSRTAFQKTVLATLSKKNTKINFFFLEPEELFKDKQQNLNISGVTYNLNIKKKIGQLDFGLTVLSLTGGKAKYNTGLETFDKKGMYTINPKFWWFDIYNSGVFFKSEFAYQSHLYNKMSSYAWYAGLGYTMKRKMRPTFYYRYAQLSGDNQNTQTYERFDPILTGGLGNWVQGINFRKVVGNGNVFSHRFQFQLFLNTKFDLSIDHFILTADKLNNVGGLAPISSFKNKMIGNETTLTTRYFINKNLMLLGIFSHTFEGKAIKLAFNEPTYNWTTFQIALFLFI